MKALWHLPKKRKAFWLAILAGLFTGAEAVVAAGIELPGSHLIPVQLRGVAILTLTAVAFYLRWRASKEE